MLRKVFVFLLSIVISATVPASIENDGCQNMVLFWNSLSRQSSLDAFKAITEPLACQECPLETKIIRNKLITLVLNGRLNHVAILQDVVKTGSLNRLDALLSTLLRIFDFGNLETQTKHELYYTLVYLIRKRYLKINDYYGGVKIYKDLEPKALDANSQIRPGSESNVIPGLPNYWTQPNSALNYWPSSPRPQSNPNLIIRPTRFWQNRRAPGFWPQTNLDQIYGPQRYWPGFRPQDYQPQPNLDVISGRPGYNFPSNPDLISRFPWPQPNLDLIAGPRGYPSQLNPNLIGRGKGLLPLPIRRPDGLVIGQPSFPGFIPRPGAPNFGPNNIVTPGENSQSCLCQSKMFELLLKKLGDIENNRRLVLCTHDGSKDKSIVIPESGDVTPGGGVIIPGSGGRIPGPGVIIPGGGGRIPDSGFVIPGSDGRIPAGVVIPGSRDRNGDSAFVIPGSGDRIPGAGVIIPGADGRIPGAGVIIPGPGGRIPDSGFVIPGSDGRIPGSGVVIPGTIGINSFKKQEETIHKKIHIQDLINVVPRPQYQIEKDMYEKLKALLDSDLIKNLINNLNLTNNLSDREVLNKIIETVTHTVKNEEIQDVFNFVHHSVNEAGVNKFNFGNLIEVLPQPQNSKEAQYYHIIKQFLSGDFLYNHDLGSDFFNTNDLNERFWILVNKFVNDSQVPAEVREALLYFLPMFNLHRINVDFGKTIHLLPEPSTDNERNHFANLKIILGSPELYAFLQNYHPENMTEDQQLNLILHYLITNNNYQRYKDDATYYQNWLATHRFGFNYFNLLHLLSNADDQDQVSVLNDYFYSISFENLLSQLKLDTLSDSEKLSSILEAIIHSNASQSVIHSAQIALEHFRMQHFYENIDKIIQIIPLPNTEDEKLKYLIVTQFLKSPKAYLLLNTIDVSLFPDDKLLIEFILKYVVDSDVAQEIKEAAEYYIDLNEKLQAIEFITRKEIKRKFKLTEIFTDTLDLNSLTLLQKNAFKKFFKYISEIKPDAMSRFSSWDEAKTRGEFMKLLFKHLLESPDTIPEIKESILVLNSLVKMHGKAALPP